MQPSAWSADGREQKKFISMPSLIEYWIFISEFVSGIRMRNLQKCECSDTVDPHMSLGATQRHLWVCNIPAPAAKDVISCPKTFCVCAFGPWECIPSSGLGKRWAIGSAGCGPNSIEYPFLD